MLQVTGKCMSICLVLNKSKSGPKLRLHFFSGFLAPLCILIEFTYGLAFLHRQHKIHGR